MNNSSFLNDIWIGDLQRIFQMIHRFVEIRKALLPANIIVEVM